MGKKRPNEIFKLHFNYLFKLLTVTNTMTGHLPFYLREVSHVKS